MEIKYRIFESYIEDDESLSGQYGYFQFCVGDRLYGEYREDIELDILSIDIYEWFTSFLKATRILEEENYVLINDVESFNTWIELRREEENLLISKISGGKVGQGSWIRKEKLPNIESKFWEDKKVLFSEFKKEVVTKSKDYLEELKELNDSFNSSVLELKKLIND